MNFTRWTGGILFAFAASLFLANAGCSKKEEPTGKDAQAKAKGAKDADQDSKGKKDAAKKDDHSGWWCEEHGVPEHLCSLCSDDVAKKLKEKGDWCKLHDRAKSQCFKCDPKLYAGFEAMHVAKYGKKPPRPPEEEFKN